METTTKRVFFKNSDTLARMFTQPNNWNQDIQGKYMEDGLKPIEAFENDIYQNLVEWSFAKDTIYYRTKNYWYSYTLKKIQNCDIIECTRHDNSKWIRLDTWMNRHSTGCGKEWLLKPEQKAKYVPLFHIEKEITK